MQEKLKHKGILDYLKEKKKLPLLIGGLLLGILLLLVGGTKTSENPNSNEDPLVLRAEELAAFELRLEKEIEVLCESVAGVSDATVMLSLAKGYRVEYAADSAGDPLTVGSGSNEEAVFSALLPPTVTGIGVVCRGGSGAEVQRVLTELISTALGIPANRVYIAGK